jgi:hypothetical protein
VILLENFNEWNLSQQKKDPRKKRKKEREKKEEKQKKREQGLKRRRGETSYEEAPCFKRREKKRMKFTSCWERFYRKKERKEIIFSYSAKFDVWPHSYPHIVCICTTFYILTFPFLAPIHYTILHHP